MSSAMRKILTNRKTRCIQWAARPSLMRSRCRGQQGAVMKDGLPAIGRYWFGVQAKRPAFAPGPSPARATGPPTRRTTNGSVGAAPGRSPQRSSRDRPRRAARHHTPALCSHVSLGPCSRAWSANRRTSSIRATSQTSSDVATQCFRDGLTPLTTAFVNKDAVPVGYQHPCRRVSDAVDRRGMRIIPKHHLN
jgi:hypothetical protein